MYLYSSKGPKEKLEDTFHYWWILELFIYQDTDDKVQCIDF